MNEKFTINTQEVHISGDEVVAYMEEMYDHDDLVARVYEDYKWGIYNVSGARQVKLQVLKEYQSN